MAEFGDIFWAKDISILYDSDRLVNFFPSPIMTINEKLNSIVRLCFYISIILIIYKGSFKYINLFLLALVFTYIIETNQSDFQRETSKQSIEKLTNSIDLDNFQTYREARLRELNVKETPPEEGNPFGNVTFVDHLDNPQRGPAMDITDPLVKKQIDIHFNKNLYNDVTDVFGKVNSQRQFYTMPVTEIPNDRESFQNWLYGEGAINSGFGKTCKENQNSCYRYNDPRQQQQILTNKYINPT